MPTINQAECIGCGACLDVCEQNAIDCHTTHGHAVMEINQYSCIDCGMCKNECLNEAIA